MTTALPTARDADRALHNLRRHGMCVIPGALDADTLGRARDALHRAADEDRGGGRAAAGFALDTDERNQRVWNLLNRDPVFARLAEHPLALTLVRGVLGWPALLSNISGNITRPGSARGVLHADQIFVPEPWPRLPQGINVAWCIDDFTAANGATEVCPGSHLENRPPAPGEEPAMIPVEAPAGSAFAFDSRVWHRTGPNVTDAAQRGAVFPFYTTPIYRPQENWFLALEPQVVEQASDTLLTLLAYRSEGFGLVYGRSPDQAAAAEPRLPGLAPLRPHGRQAFGGRS